MENNNVNDYAYQNVIQLNEADASRRFMANVFMWMFVALGISAFCAYAFATSPALLATLIDPGRGLSGFGMFILFSPLIFVLVMRFGMNRIAFPVLMLIFIAYAIVMGITFSFILLAYTASSVVGVFITASLLFGVMAVAGYTTKTDLTKFGSLMFMLLIGIIIASIVNWFLHSSGLDLMITYVGVAVFTGLTAYKTQMLKNIGAGLEYGDATSKKLALMGGLSLYITFVNLFLMLIRIFGRRR